MTTRLAAAALSLALAVPALAANIKGFEVPDTIAVEGKELRRHGSGVRKKFIVKVYLGSLYTVTPVKTTEDVIDPDVPKAVRLDFMRDVTKGQMMDAFREGFRNNSPKEAEALAKRLDRLGEALPGEMKERSVLTFTYVPGKGTVVAAGERQVVVEGKDFNDALMRNWLGMKPADDDLKKGMLNAK